MRLCALCGCAFTPDKRHPRQKMCWKKDCTKNYKLIMDKKYKPRRGQIGCVVCGATFTPHGGHKTCSKACSIERKRSMRTRQYIKRLKYPEARTCPECGYSFFTVEGVKKYCSGRCRRLAFNKARRIYRRGSSVIGRLHKCVTCGSVFMQTRRNKKHCGRNCHRSSRRSRRDKGGSRKDCITCGAQFWSKHKDRAYCSLRCWKKNRAARDPEYLPRKREYEKSNRLIKIVKTLELEAFQASQRILRKE